MNKILAVALMVGLSMTISAASKKGYWKMGTVTDTQMNKSYVETGGEIRGHRGDGYIIGPSITERKFGVTTMSTQVAIAGADYTYIVSDEVRKGAVLTLNRKKGCRYVVGDEIRYMQERKSLHIMDDDGRKCVVEIIRQERRGSRP